MPVRLIGQGQDPQDRLLWRLHGPTLPVACDLREHPHGLELFVMQGDELARSELVRTGPADAEGRAAALAGCPDQEGLQASRVRPALDKAIQSIS